MSEIFLVTHWTSGDVFPFIRLGRSLRKEGHDITVFTHCIYEKTVRDNDMNFVSLDTPEIYEEMNQDMYMLADPVNNREECINFYKKYHGAERLLYEVKLIEKYCHKDTVIISRFRSSISGQLAAEKNGLRYASMILAPNYFSHMELHDQILGKELCSEINNSRKDLGLCQISGWKEWLYSPSCILCAWPEWYAQRDETWPDGACCAGFTGKYASDEEIKDSSLIDFINNSRKSGKKIVTVTGGSSRMIKKDFYSVSVKACVNAGVNTVAAVPYDDFVPDCSDKSVFRVKSVPLASLLKMSDAVIHHGGMGTINESVDAGIPQIILPHLTDGPDNADRLVKLGAAVKFPVKMWDPDLISDSLRKILSGERVTQCRIIKEKNDICYAEKKWKELIAGLKEFKYSPSDIKKDLNDKKYVTSSDIKNRFTREQLMEIARKKIKRN